MTSFLFLALLLLMLVVGVLSGRNASTEDYQIYGRQLKRLGFITTYIATFVGAGFMMAGTSYAFSFGVALLWYVAGHAVGILVYGFFSTWM